MSARPEFELFEVLCAELSGRATQTIPEDRLDGGLLRHVMSRFDEPSAPTAFKRALEAIDQHFEERNGVVPYTVNVPTREFSVVDVDYLNFIAFAKSSRSIEGGTAKMFEKQTLTRLRKRLAAGDLKCVGWPRGKHRRKKEFVGYLQRLGFEDDCMRGKDKDGGLDILWLPPLGSVPTRPIVSVQCKNGFIDEGEANRSNGRAMKTLSHHAHQKREQLRFIVFNDYIDDRAQKRLTGCTFFPLGLTDLASLRDRGTDETL